MRKSVFTKIFAYTMLLLLLMCLAATLLFARQFISYYRDEHQRQLSESFQPMLVIMGDKDKTWDEIIEAAGIFADNNQSFSFMIQEADGRVVYSTENLRDFPIQESGLSLRLRFMGLRSLGDGPGSGYIFTGYASGANDIDYGDLVSRSLLALGIMLVIAIFGAILFARKVTQPLEDELVRERAMEENQRLFFSAASHELKTPIASARALVEGMLAGVGDYRDHPKYLKECLKNLDSQAALVSEILEIVKLTDKAPHLLPHTFVDLRELGNSVLAEYRPQAERRGLLITGVFPQAAVAADRNLLHRVLSNIIANAIQNTPECGEIKIESEEHKLLRLKIFNTGTHIPDEVISRIFEPFYKLDIARTRHNTQSGLGLAIVKKALDRMSIPFGLENSANGVLFWMDLHVNQAAGMPLGKCYPKGIDGVFQGKTPS